MWVLIAPIKNHKTHDILNWLNRWWKLSILLERVRLRCGWIISLGINYFTTFWPTHLVEAVWRSLIQPIIPGEVQHQPLPNSKPIRAGSRKSYGPYVKSYASSVCTESEIPEQYQPYSDEEYSDELSEELHHEPEVSPSGSDTEDDMASAYPYAEDDNGIELDFFGSDRKTTQCIMSWKRNDDAYLTPNSQVIGFTGLPGSKFIWINGGDIPSNLRLNRISLRVRLLFTIGFVFSSDPVYFIIFMPNQPHNYIVMATIY